MFPIFLIIFSLYSHYILIIIYSHYISICPTLTHSIQIKSSQYISQEIPKVFPLRDFPFLFSVFPMNPMIHPIYFPGYSHIFPIYFPYIRKIPFFSSQKRHDIRHAAARQSEEERQGPHGAPQGAGALGGHALPRAAAARLGKDP